MKIIFCKIAWMKDYNGITENDKPINGGNYVDETGHAHEEYNFQTVHIEDDELLINCHNDECGFFPKGDYHIGFVEPKSRNKIKTNQIRIENIGGCELCKSELYISGVLVVWCATAPQGGTKVVGWYKNATIYRELQGSKIPQLEGRHYFRCDDDLCYFNVVAESQNCVLLPHKERNANKWGVPSSKKGSFGFGQSMIWYATEQSAEQYIKDLIGNINKGIPMRTF